MLDLKTMGSKPGIEMRRLAGADLVAEARAEKTLTEHHTGIGGEDQVRQARLRRHPFDLYTQSDQCLIQLLPLSPGSFRGAAAFPRHPRIDLVFDPVIIRRAHQDSRCV